MINFYMYMLLNLLSVLMLIIFVLVGVAYITLLERKILGFIQMRKGPNKVGYIGILQPFSDAIKLFSKESFSILKSNVYIYYLSPMVSFLVMLIFWMILPSYTNLFYMNNSILILFILMGVMSYMLVFMGWSSNSLYSVLGAFRSVSQILSYEVSFIMIILNLNILSEGFSFLDVYEWQKFIWFLIMLMPIFIIFYLSILAELNRTPIDFIEGESELVSGFNIEYFSGGFALIFMSEYGMIIYFSIIMMLLFTNLMFSIISFMMLVIFSSSIIIVRGLLPRMRYDELMNLCWKIILPNILNYFLFILGFKSLFMIIN